MESLLYEFLNEMLMLFCIDKLVCKEVKILEFDRAAFRIKAQGKGERWTREKHRHGTEIKAITYSAMQLYEKDGRAEVFVIVVRRLAPHRATTRLTRFIDRISEFVYV